MGDGWGIETRKSWKRETEMEVNGGEEKEGLLKYGFLCAGEGELSLTP